MTDERDPDVEALENRIETLEEIVMRMLPSRRDAIKMGGAALVGGSLAAGSASALPDPDEDEVGTIGASGDPVDLFAEDISELESINGDRLVTSGESKDFEVQKDGSDGSGVINFKTS